MNNRQNWNDGGKSKKMIKNCRIHWLLIGTSGSASGAWDELLTLEEAANTIANFNVMYKNTIKYKHWFEFEDVPVDGERLELADEQ